MRKTKFRHISFLHSLRIEAYSCRAACTTADVSATGLPTAICTTACLSAAFSTAISIAVLVCCTFYLASNDAYGMVPPIIYGLLVGVFAALGLRIYYFAKVISTLNSFIHSVHTRYPSYGASLFVAVMCFISGGLSVISLPFAFSLASLCSAAVTICFGVIIIQLRSLIYRLRYECDMAQR